MVDVIYNGDSRVHFMCEGKTQEYACWEEAYEEG
jgi:hypothetical protein